MVNFIVTKLSKYVENDTFCIAAVSQLLTTMNDHSVPHRGLSRLRERMAKDWPFLDIPAGPAALVLECLEASWPEAITLTPGRAGLACQDRAFLVALVGLQDAGWVMCEALLAGSGQEPYALETALTAKGRNELARYRNSG